MPTSRTFPRTTGLPRDPLPARHGRTAPKLLSARSQQELPPLPAIDWAKAGGKKPQLLPVKGYKNGGPLPKADVVIITWTSAEWQAFDHVFCDGDSTMAPHATSAWAKQWLPYSRDYLPLTKPRVPNANLTTKSPSLYNKAWGTFRLVQLGSGKKAIIFKSEMHVSEDGPNLPLVAMTENILADSRAGLVLSIGTAGGARPQDCLGSVNITDGAHFLLSGSLAGKPFNNQTFSSAWKPKTTLLNKVRKLLIETPVTMPHLEELASKIKGDYALARLFNKEVAPGKIAPLANVLRIPVLTTNGFVIGTTDGKYKTYAAMEMDDAVVAMVCATKKVNFCVVRNISDPVQNADLPFEAQKDWGSTIYGNYGLYTSFNGALCAWAVVSAM
jgi:nucleoside phosphorylase